MASLRTRICWNRCSAGRLFSTSYLVREDPGTGSGNNSIKSTGKTPIATDFGGISLTPRKMEERKRRDYQPRNPKFRAQRLNQPLRDGTLARNLARHRDSSQKKRHDDAPMPASEQEEEDEESMSDTSGSRISAKEGQPLDYSEEDRQAKEQQDRQAKKKTLWMVSHKAALRDNSWLELLSWENDPKMIKYHLEVYRKHDLWAIAISKLRQLAIQRVLWEDRQQRLRGLDTASQGKTDGSHISRTEDHVSSSEEVEQTQRQPNGDSMLNTILDPKNVDEFIRNMPTEYLEGNLKGIVEFISLEDAVTLLRPDPPPKIEMDINPESNFTVLYGGISTDHAPYSDLKKLSGDYSQYFSPMDWSIATSANNADDPLPYASLLISKNYQLNAGLNRIKRHAHVNQLADMGLINENTRKGLLERDSKGHRQEVVQEPKS